jgi:hypothetical protein
VLALKLMLVPTFLLVVSLAGKSWRPAVAGSLAGLPLVTGPIMLFLAMEQGEVFASSAASSSLSGVLAAVAFSAGYANAAQRMSWLPCLAIALLAWGASVALLSVLPASFGMSLAVALVTLIFAPRSFPARVADSGVHAITQVELISRMLAGAVLTVAVTFASSALGAGWSGLLAVFPVLGSVLALFSHRTHGAASTGVLLHAMAMGAYSIAVFCGTLALTLPRLGIAGAFTVAVALTALVQALTRRLLRRGGVARHYDREALVVERPS